MMEQPDSAFSGLSVERIPWSSPLNFKFHFSTFPNILRIKSTKNTKHSGALATEAQTLNILQGHYREDSGEATNTGAIE
jgi:hypothetical protein